MKLEFWAPLKPLLITQAWGIKNPSYEQFGFSRHNGTDIAPGKDNKIQWPVKNCRVYDTEWGDATGWRIKANTLDAYDFPDGKTAYVNIVMLHMAAKSPVRVGSIIDVGDFVGFTGTTGFSTGPHTHITGRRIDAAYNLIDTNDADNSFDLMTYWNGYYAVDGSVVIGTLKALVGVLQQMVTALTKKAPITN